MRVVRFALFAVLGLTLVAPLTAQAPVTVTDLSRLNTTAAEISKLNDSLRKTDPTLATEVDKALADAKDEIVYLNVKLRKDGAVTRDEYAALRDRLETLRIKAQGQKVSAAPVPDDKAAPTMVSVPVGTEFDIKLQTSLNSGITTITFLSPTFRLPRISANVFVFGASSVISSTTTMAFSFAL